MVERVLHWKTKAGQIFPTQEEAMKAEVFEAFQVLVENELAYEDAENITHFFAKHLNTIHDLTCQLLIHIPKQFPEER